MIYETTVGEQRILGLIFQRDATSKEAAALKGKFTARSAVGNEAGIELPGGAQGKANSELQLPLTSRGMDGTLKLPGNSAFYGDAVSGEGVRDEARKGNFKIGSFEELPSNAKNTYGSYEKNGWKGNFNGQTPGTAAGGTYRNRNGLLPTIDSTGNSITYKEFDVNNYTPGVSRDMERFVVGSDGSIYYTDSHYGDGKSPSALPPFVKIK